MLGLALLIYDFCDRRDKAFDASEFLRYFKFPVPAEKVCRPILQAAVSAKLREYVQQYEEARVANNESHEPDLALYHTAVWRRSSYQGAVHTAEKFGFHPGTGFYPGEVLYVVFEPR